MKKRSSASTFVLAGLLVACLAVVGAAVNPKPAEPQKSAEDQAKEAAAASPKQPPKEAQDEMKKMQEMYKKTKGARAKLMEQPSNAENPTAMDVSAGYYMRESDGATGSEKLTARMAKKQEEINRSGQRVSPMPPAGMSSPKPMAELTPQEMAAPEKHGPGDGHNH